MNEVWTLIVSTWQFPLFRTQSGAITVGQIVLVALLVTGASLSAVACRACWRGVCARRICSGTHLQRDAAHALERILFYSTLIAVVMTALSLLHIPLTAFAFVSGAIAIGVGFGAQNVIGNFISGWILMSERPVRIGDFIEINGSLGVVEMIATRSTRAAGAAPAAGSAGSTLR